MIRDLNVHAERLTVVTVVGRTVNVDLNPTGLKFMCAIRLPSQRGAEDDKSPRSLAAYRLYYRGGVLGLTRHSLKAGYRLKLTRYLSGDDDYTGDYELLTNPKQLKSASDSQGYEVDAMPVDILYPYSGDLKSQDGTFIATVKFALWSDSETHSTTGTYENFSGEAPIEYAGTLRANTSLWVGTERYRVVSSFTDLQGPRVRFEARRANA